MSGWWWLSFASEDGFLGAAIVPGDDIVTATLNAHLLDINPGGEVMGIEVPEERGDPPERWRERLLSRAEVDELDAEMAERYG